MIESFVIALPSGAEVAGERDLQDSFLGSVILLHDEERDLDQMRPIATALRAAGFDVIMIDLPGHGLSSGTVEVDGPEVIGALLNGLPDGSVCSVVAEGASADLILGSSSAAALTAFVLLSPRSRLAPQAYAEAPSRFIPSLVLLDPRDEAASHVTEMLRAHARATWGRIFAHRDARSDSGAELWQVRAAESSARFLAEKASFARHRRGSHARSKRDDS